MDVAPVMAEDKLERPGMKHELPESKTQYFSHARMEMLVIIDW
jgi:hypothetical protein